MSPVSEIDGLDMDGAHVRSWEIADGHLIVELGWRGTDDGSVLLTIPVEAIACDRWDNENGFVASSRSGRAAPTTPRTEKP